MVKSPGFHVGRQDSISIKDDAALSFPCRLAAVNNLPELSSPPVKQRLQPDDILAAPADGVAAGCSRPSSRFRGISSWRSGHRLGIPRSA